MGHRRVRERRVEITLRDHDGKVLAVSWMLRTGPGAARSGIDGVSATHQTSRPSTRHPNTDT
jgi:hypothetical protein